MTSALLFTALNSELKFPDGTKFYPDMQDGEYGFNTAADRGADTFHPFKVEEFQIITWTMSNSASNLSVLNLKGFSDTPNYVSVSAVNNVWMDFIYDARASTTQVKTCAYATSQTIAYENVSTRMPIFTKDQITIVPLVSGVRDKKATAIIARITDYNS